MIRLKTRRRIVLAIGATAFVTVASMSAFTSAKEIATANAVVADYPVNGATALESKVPSVNVQKTSFAPTDTKLRALQTGVASYYGPGFHGRRTANGETFNMNAMTAAHRTLPFGTKLKVTNLNNGQSTIVRVNDRGPYVGGRIIDLSVAAAKQIGSTTSGTAQVKLEVVEQ
ncbi:septal ring lytic transglycosylase RlpA family protein [Hydromonas duriensis]|uniref:Endolytic peptidoglycan transglycosylase RlpA n=1 Tax=Hydromonas duriensis TaxID=1527608 RepID=A0A4R6YBG0_9BURK|nr:septal ring lytic transglycosylase RlpA family protein [Hydromonas duriensis]TDR32975.1 rare lipoprotein A [Hydromonas duriensis]